MFPQKTPWGSDDQSPKHLHLLVWSSSNPQALSKVPFAICWLWKPWPIKTNDFWWSMRTYLLNKHGVCHVFFHDLPIQNGPCIFNGLVYRKVYRKTKIFTWNMGFSWTKIPQTNPLFFFVTHQISRSYPIGSSYRPHFPMTIPYIYISSNNDFIWFITNWFIWFICKYKHL